MFPIHFDKTSLDFGIDPHKQCPINVVLTDTLVSIHGGNIFLTLITHGADNNGQTLENVSKERVEYRFHHALRNHKMSLLFTPNHGFLRPGKIKEIKVELVMKITTSISEPVVIEAVGMFSFISSLY